MNCIINNEITMIFQHFLHNASELLINNDSEAFIIPDCPQATYYDLLTEKLASHSSVSASVYGLLKPNSSAFFLSAAAFSSSPVFSLCLAMVVVVIPVELGFLLYLGKKANGRLSLKGIVLNRERVKTWQYFVYGFIILVWSTLTFVILQKPVGGCDKDYHCFPRVLYSV